MLEEGAFLAGRYRVIQFVTHGGMALLYQGRDLHNNAPVAIKVLRPEIAERPELVERLRHEATILARLQHPNIVGYVDFFLVSGLPCLVMAWVEGETLKQHLAGRKGPYAVGELDGLLHGLCDALTHMQGRGVVHRDIKPGNILMAPDGQPVLIDFSIALLRSTAEQDPLARTPAGTASYMAPEQMAGQMVDIRADVYALGTVVFEMLTLARPFADAERGTSTDMRWQRLLEAKTTRAAPSLARYREDLPLRYVAAVDRALAQRPEDRWSTPARLRAAWTPQADLPVDTKRAMRPPRSKIATLIAMAVVLLAGGSLAVLGAVRPGPAPATNEPLNCQTAVVQGSVDWTMCIESAFFSGDRLHVNVRWEVTVPANQVWRKQSDLGNTNMYLLDRPGQRYAITAVGGAAGEATLKGAQALRGWFEFAMLGAASGPLTFVDDDTGLRLQFTAR